MSNGVPVWKLPLPLDEPGATVSSSPALFSQVCDPQRLGDACDFVSAHPARYPVEDASWDQMRAAPEEFLAQLEWDLRCNAYEPSPVTRLYRLRPRGRADLVRVLMARDRVVCFALFRALEPRLLHPASVICFHWPALAQFLRDGCYRIADGSGGEGVSIETLFEVLREVQQGVPDETVRMLIKQLLRAPLADEIRLAS